MTVSTIPIQYIPELVCVLILVKLIIFIVQKGPHLYQEIKNYKYLLKLPGPKRYPIIGNAFESFTDEVTLFNNLRKWAKDYSPVYAIVAFPYSLVNLTRPDEVQKLISTSKHSNKSFLYEFLHTFVAEGLATNNGVKWQQNRKLLNSAFHINVLQQFIDSFHKRGHKLVEDFEKHVKMENNNVIDVVPLIYIHVVKAVRETLMGNSFDENTDADKEYAEAFNDYADIVPARMKKPWLYNNFIYYNFTRIGIREKNEINIMLSYGRQLFNNRINELKTKSFNTNDGKHMPFMDLLINAQNEGKRDWKYIQEEINTFLVGSSDTTTNSLSFTLMLLANHQNIQDEIVDEINELFPDANAVISLQKLNELKLLERCVKESLRLYPSLPWITRTLDEDLITTNNHKIPKGCSVGIHIFDLHRNPDIFPDPEKFDPDRFLPENCQNRHPYAYIPFSAGPRNCIGLRFAMIELKIFLINILRNFKLEPIDTQNTLTLYGGPFLRLKNGIRVKFVYRNKC